MTRAREVSFTRVMISLLIGGDDTLHHLQQDHLEEDLSFAHTQDFTGLILPAGNAFDAAAINLREIAGIIEDKGHHHSGKARQQIPIKNQARPIIDHDEL